MMKQTLAFCFSLLLLAGHVHAIRPRQSFLRPVRAQPRVLDVQPDTLIQLKDEAHVQAKDCGVTAIIGGVLLLTKLAKAGYDFYSNRHKEFVEHQQDVLFAKLTEQMCTELKSDYEAHRKDVEIFFNKPLKEFLSQEQVTNLVGKTFVEARQKLVAAQTVRQAICADPTSASPCSAVYFHLNALQAKLRAVCKAIPVAALTRVCLPADYELGPCSVTCGSGTAPVKKKATSECEDIAPSITLPCLPIPCEPAAAAKDKLVDDIQTYIRENQLIPEEILDQVCTLLESANVLQLRKLSDIDLLPPALKEVITDAVKDTAAQLSAAAAPLLQVASAVFGVFSAFTVFVDIYDTFNEVAEAVDKHQAAIDYLTERQLLREFELEIAVCQFQKEILLRSAGLARHNRQLDEWAKRAPVVSTWKPCLERTPAGGARLVSQTSEIDLLDENGQELVFSNFCDTELSPKSAEDGWKGHLDHFIKNKCPATFGWKMNEKTTPTDLLTEGSVMPSHAIRTNGPIFNVMVAKGDAAHISGCPQNTVYKWQPVPIIEVDKTKNPIVRPAGNYDVAFHICISRERQSDDQMPITQVRAWALQSEMPGFFRRMFGSKTAEQTEESVQARNILDSKKFQLISPDEPLCSEPHGDNFTQPKRAVHLFVHRGGSQPMTNLYLTPETTAVKRLLAGRTVEDKTYLASQIRSYDKTNLWCIDDDNDETDDDNIPYHLVIEQDYRVYLEDVDEVTSLV